jgi:hypothetical protein
MGNAIWLLVALPQWYFSSIRAPLAAGLLSLVPTIGTIFLGLSLVAGLVRRRVGLLLFAIPFAISESLVAAAGLFRGQVQNPEAILLVFLVLQIAISACLIYRLKGSRSISLGLTIFSVAYALFGAFVSAMSFRESWL